MFSDTCLMSNYGPELVQSLEHRLLVIEVPGSSHGGDGAFADCCLIRGILICLASRLGKVAV